MEKELIDKCVDNDRLAQKAVYEKMFVKLYPVCKRYLKREDDAMDALNVGMLKVFRNIRQFSGEGPFEAWVKRIIINTCLDVIKAAKKNITDVVPDTTLLNHASVDNAAMSNMGIEELYELIRKLPPMSQTVFNMHIVDGYPHKEISDMLGISQGTTKWHVSFAKQELRKMIEKKTQKISWHHE